MKTGNLHHMVSCPNIQQYHIECATEKQIELLQNIFFNDKNTIFFSYKILSFNLELTNVFSYNVFWHHLKTSNFPFLFFINFFSSKNYASFCFLPHFRLKKKNDFSLSPYKPIKFQTLINAVTSGEKRQNSGFLKQQTSGEINQLILFFSFPTPFFKPLNFIRHQKNTFFPLVLILYH